MVYQRYLAEARKHLNKNEFHSAANALESAVKNIPDGIDGIDAHDQIGFASHSAYFMAKHHDASSRFLAVSRSVGYGRIAYFFDRHLIGGPLTSF